MIPSAFNRDVAPAVAEAVAREARSSGWAQADDESFGYATGDTARVPRDPGLGVAGDPPGASPVCAAMTSSEGICGCA